MRRWILKLHLYAGLVSFAAFMVYGATGIYVTLRPAPVERAAPPSSSRMVPFDVPGGLDDKAVADLIFETLDLPLTGRVPAWALRRDGAGHLLVNFYTVNGNRRVTVLEDEGTLRIETERRGFGAFVNGLHATTLNSPSPSGLVRAWGWYTELAIWSLLLMCMTGVYLWLASRPRHQLARASAALGIGAFVFLYWMTKR